MPYKCYKYEQSHVLWNLFSFDPTDNGTWVNRWQYVLSVYVYTYIERSEVTSQSGELYPLEKVKIQCLNPEKHTKIYTFMWTLLCAIVAIMAGHEDNNRRCTGDLYSEHVTFVSKCKIKNYYHHTSTFTARPLHTILFALQIGLFER